MESKEWGATSPLGMRGCGLEDSGITTPSGLSSVSGLTPSFRPTISSGLSLGVVYDRRSSLQTSSQTVAFIRYQIFDTDQVNLVAPKLASHIPA